MSHTVWLILLIWFKLILLAKIIFFTNRLLNRFFIIIYEELNCGSQRLFFDSNGWGEQQGWDFTRNYFEYRSIYSGLLWKWKNPIGRKAAKKALETLAQNEKINERYTSATRELMNFIVKNKGQRMTREEISKKVGYSRQVFWGRWCLLLFNFLSFSVPR